MAGTKRGMPFERTGPFPIDDTFVLSKAEMLAVADAKMPEKYFAVCKDDGMFYLYDKSATASAETGKFSVVEGGDAGHMELTQAEYDALTDEQKLNGTVYFITDGEGGGGGGGGSYVLPPATANTLGGVKVGYGLNVTADGTLSATGGGDANFEVDEQYNYVNVNNNVQYLSMDFNDSDTLSVAAYNPGTYMASRVLATKDYVDAHATEYTAGENIAIDSNNVISANSIYVDKNATTLWTGRIDNNSANITISSGTWNDYDEVEFWGGWGNNDPTSPAPDPGSMNLFGTIDVKALSDHPNALQYICRSYESNDSGASYYSTQFYIQKTGNNTARIAGSRNSNISRALTKIVGIKYNNLGAYVGSVTQNGNNLPIVNNTLSFNTPRAISTRMDGEITGMRVVEDGGGIPASITFNRDIDGVQVIMEDEAERLNKVLVDKDAAQTLTSPNGTKYKLKVADDGTLSTEVV